MPKDIRILQLFTMEVTTIPLRRLQVIPTMTDQEAFGVAGIPDCGSRRTSRSPYL